MMIRMFLIGMALLAVCTESFGADKTATQFLEQVIRDFNSGDLASYKGNV